MYQIITHTLLGHSLHTLYSKDSATIFFNGACAGAVEGQLIEAIFFYGPEGQINNWLRERAE